MRYVSVFVLLLLAGCSSQPSQQPAPAAQNQSPPPAPAAAPVDSRPVIVAYGDSLSAGYGVPAGKSYPDFLQKTLDEAGYRYRVVNAGISGDTTSGGLSRLNAILALKPQIAILELGGNDGLRGLPVKSSRSNLEKIITGLQGAGVTVVLAGMTLPPNYGPEYIQSFEKMYVDLAKQYNVTLIPFLLDGIATDSALMQPDGIHPNAEGHRRMAQLVMKYLEPLLKKQTA